MNHLSHHTSATTRRLAALNAALRRLEADFGREHADTFRRDLSTLSPAA